MEILEKKDNKIILVQEIDESLANAVRRYVNEIPMIAIDEVEIFKNDSASYDETIAHRLGLIPLVMDKSINEKTEVDLKLVSSKKGVVYSGEIKGKVKPVYDKIPITHLDEGQELEVVGKARVGRGSEHSKFSPGLMFYTNAVEIKIDKNCPREIIEVCPRGVFSGKDGKITVVDANKCDMCEACVKKCEDLDKKDAIKIIPQNKLIITIESFGQITAKEIFSRAIKELKKDLEETEKKVSK